MTYMVWLRLAALILVAAAGCTQRDALACVDGQCSDPERPFCDVNGVYEESNGAGNTCIPTPSNTICLEDFEECVGDVHFLCRKDDFSMERQCALGCAPFEERCMQVVPSGQSGFVLQDELPSFDFGVPMRIRTSDGVAIAPDGEETPLGGQLVTPPTGGVLMWTVSVETWKSRELVLEGEPGFILLAQGDVVLDGEIDVGQSGKASAICEDSNGVDDSGAGFGDVGGSSGGQSAPASGNAFLVPLRGGCGTGGGGAIQITSQTRIHLKSGHVQAGGRGGNSGFTIDGPFFTGGSSGGGILLEAPVVDLAENVSIAANGGSGACPPDGNIIEPEPKPGERGQVSEDTTPTAMECANAGGSGGSVMQPAGGAGMVARGGGSVGRIRINTRDGNWSGPGGAGIVSPAPSIGRVSAQ